MAALNPHLTTKSMFGSQARSTRRSAPQYGFGSSTRAHQAKVFMSAEHAKLAIASSSPGPSAYSARASVGPQIDGKKATAPQWVFGNSERFMGNTKPSLSNPGPGAYDMHSGVGNQVSSAKQSQPSFGFGTANREHVAKVYVSEDHNKSLHGIESPGPMMYTLDKAIGAQQLSQKSNQPKWVFGSHERFQYEHVKRAATSPGPGSYTQRAAVGTQVASTKASSPMPGFGTSNRAHMEKIFISHEHEKSQKGNNSPGPCNYAIPESHGHQTNSRYRSGQCWGFGTAERWSGPKGSARQSSTPGPGTYCV